MVDLIPFTAISYLFEEFEHTAWRLESRRGYASDQRMTAYEEFLAGGLPDEDMADPYYTARRRQADAGKRFERVRIVDDPPTDGQRFLLYRARFNVAAGEDVRYLYRRDAERLRLPDRDFWLFDSQTVADLHFTDADEIVGVVLSTDPADAVAASHVRDTAWRHALPYAEFSLR